ncbi:MAG: NAD(P)H-hydrate epimerase [Planctomycetes bacterium]|nr:NAD(P)H-hydrate epimerase [Planctomycetota bacterium]
MLLCMERPYSLTRQQSRLIDTIAIDQYGIPGMVLMENAGRGVVDVLLELDPTLTQNPEPKIAILCGKGNNGGDGFVIARHLAIRGARPVVLLLASASELRGDALQNYQILTHCGVPIVDLSGESDLGSALDAEASDAGWLVDALLGTGALGEPRAPLPLVIRWMNGQNAKRLAIDVPSGLDCDTGQAGSHCVRADHTCTFVASKIGFAMPGAQPYLGQVHIVSIGVPSELIVEVALLPPTTL